MAVGTPSVEFSITPWCTSGRGANRDALLRTEFPAQFRSFLLPAYSLIRLLALASLPAG